MNRTNLAYAIYVDRLGTTTIIFLCSGKGCIFYFRLSYETNTDGQNKVVLVAFFRITPILHNTHAHSPMNTHVS
jgi:hypothetical protein